MIGIKNFVPSFEIKLQTDLEVIAVQIFSKPKNITVCNIYIPPSLNDAVEQLEKVIKQLPKDNPLLLLGDFNAHHALWDSPQNNARGEKLYELIEGRSMILLNESVPTFVCDLNGQTSTLDLSVTTSDLLGEFIWSTFKNTLGSDHYPILMFASALCTMREKKPKWIIDDSKWVEFENNLKLPDIDITKDINYINNSIVEAFTRIATNTFKLSSSKIVQKRYKAWWSKDCERAIKEKNKMFRIFKAHPIMQNQINYQRAKAKSRYEVKMAKRSFKYSYLKSINERSTLSQVWNKVKFLKTNRYKETPIILQLENVKHTLQEPVEVANELAYQFAKTSSILFHKEPFVYHMVEKEFLNLNFETDSQYLYNQPFSMRELELAISQIKKNTSPGQDMLIYPFFQHLVEENKKIILKFFNLIWQSGGFPEDWKISLLVPILKPGKLHTDPSSYRPIALTSCLCKLMERMVLQRLLLYLQEHNVLSPNQSGFRKNFSTSDSLLFLECSIQETFLKNEYLVAVFLDIEKAYDTVWIHGLLLKLHHLD